jgi:hypothetical protein
MRPVKDSLPAFMADRGGIRFANPSSIADVTTAITYITADEDTLGGTFATKGCQVITCPPITEVEVAIVAKCLQFGNLQGRTWPEQVAHWVDLTAAAHARTAETALLDGIDTASDQITDAAVYGATSSLIQAFLKAAARYRSAYRMAPGTSFRVLAPEWTADLIAADLTHQQFGRFEYTRDSVKTLLGRYGVNIGWYLDEDTGAGQILAAQTAGAMGDFPTTVKWFIFPEGSFLFLDGGSLDLGLVRDSALNSTNDYQLFAETFENVAFTGLQSLAVTSTVCPSGEVALEANLITC